MSHSSPSKNTSLKQHAIEIIYRDRQSTIRDIENMIAENITDEDNDQWQKAKNWFKGQNGLVGRLCTARALKAKTMGISHGSAKFKHIETIGIARCS